MKLEVMIVYWSLSNNDSTMKVECRRETGERVSRCSERIGSDVGLTVHRVIDLDKQCSNGLMKDSSSDIDHTD